VVRTGSNFPCDLTSITSGGFQSAMCTKLVWIRTVLIEYSPIKIKVSRFLIADIGSLIYYMVLTIFVLSSRFFSFYLLVLKHCWSFNRVLYMLILDNLRSLLCAIYGLRWYLRLAYNLGINIVVYLKNFNRLFVLLFRWWSKLLISIY